VKFAADPSVTIGTIDRSLDSPMQTPGFSTKMFSTGSDETCESDQD
jgi:hypothetical protein